MTKRRRVGRYRPRVAPAFWDVEAVTKGDDVLRRLGESEFEAAVRKLPDEVFRVGDRVVQREVVVMFGDEGECQGCLHDQMPPWERLAWADQVVSSLEDLGLDRVEIGAAVDGLGRHTCGRVDA